MFLDPSPNADQAVSDLFSQFSNIKLPPVEDINVNGFKGIMVNQVPGIDPNTYIFIDINGKTYQIIYGEGALDERGKTLLEGLSFFKPLRSIESLELKRGNDVLYEASCLNSDQGRIHVYPSHA